jgi:integrase
VTQDDLLYPIRPRVCAIAAEFGTVRAACRAMGDPSLDVLPLEAAAGPPRPGDLEQGPCRNVRLPRIEREELRFLTRRDRRPHRGDPRPHPGAGVGGRLRRPADRGLAGLRPSRVDLLAGVVTMAESLAEVKGKLIAGPSKTRAGRRTVGLPPFVVRELETHLAVAERPGSHVFTAPGGGRCGVPGLRARSWVPATEAAGLQGLRIHDLRHTAVALWIAAGATPKEVAVRGGPPRSASPWTATATRRSRPVAEGRCHPARD